MRLGFAALCTALLLMAAGVRRPLWSDLPEPARKIAVQLGLSESGFTETLNSIDRRTAGRMREGDWDDLVYYMLQSRSFTEREPVEPARSAIDFLASGSVPEKVKKRIEDLVRAMRAPSNERESYLARLSPTAGEVEKQYVRAMAFLGEKEVGCREMRDPHDCIAELYKDRGLSTDTSTQAFQTVAAATGWIEKNRPEFHARRVLILGPGVDFAPRTGFRDNVPPQIYQPQQVRQLLKPAQVGCLDINPLVTFYTRTVCDANYEMNIATNLPDTSEHWDLVIATNVLLYLDDTELLLAINNVRHLLNTEGILLHNDARFQASLFGKACGLPVIHFGEVILDGDRHPPLTDRYVVHERGIPTL